MSAARWKGKGKGGTHVEEHDGGDGAENDWGEKLGGQLELAREKERGFWRTRVLADESKEGGRLGEDEPGAEDPATRDRCQGLATS